MCCCWTSTYTKRINYYALVWFFLIITNSQGKVFITKVSVPHTEERKNKYWYFIIKAFHIQQAAKKLLTRHRELPLFIQRSTGHNFVTAVMNIPVQSHFFWTSLCSLESPSEVTELLYKRIPVDLFSSRTPVRVGVVPRVTIGGVSVVCIGCCWTYSRQGLPAHVLLHWRIADRSWY